MATVDCADSGALQPALEVSRAPERDSIWRASVPRARSEGRGQDGSSRGGPGCGGSRYNAPLRARGPRRAGHGRVPVRRPREGRHDPVAAPRATVATFVGLLAVDHHLQGGQFADNARGTSGAVCRGPRSGPRAALTGKLRPGGRKPWFAFKVVHVVPGDPARWGRPLTSGLSRQPAGWTARPITRAAPSRSGSDPPIRVALARSSMTATKVWAACSRSGGRDGRARRARGRSR